MYNNIIIRGEKKINRKYNVKTKGLIIRGKNEYGLSVKELAEKYSLPQKIIEKWVPAYNKYNTVYTETEEYSEAKKPEKEIFRLRRENEILKKRYRSLQTRI